VNRKLQRIVRDILSLPTAPYHEGAVAAYIRSFARKRNLGVKADRYGNLVVRYRNGRRPRPIALSGHMDHPGFEVLGADGRDLTACWLGGCDPRHFPGSRVTLISNGREIPGRVTSALDEDRTFSIRARSSLPRVEGTFGHWRLDPAVFDGDRIRTKGADDLASCAVILAVLDRLRVRKAEADLWGVFTRAEEVGFMGAAGMLDARAVPTRVPIVVLEASPVLPGAEMGNGPVIRVGDRLSVFDPGVEFAVHNVARQLQERKRNFRFQRQLMSGGACEATLYMLHGMRVGALALPLGNYHNMGKRWPVEECISDSDVTGMVDLCTALALAPPSGETRTPMKKGFASAFRARKKRLLG
jgi:endoglucanase